MQSNAHSAIENQDSTFLGNPFPWHSKMRRESPIFYDSEQESWMVFCYEDVKHVFANWQMFSSKIPHPPEQMNFTQSMNYTDPPKHQTLRSLVAKVFTVRRVEELAPRIQQISHELIDRVQSCDHMDFVHDFAIPLPVILIAEILGVPIEDRENFKQWSDGIVVLDPSALEAMATYFRHLIKQRRKAPGKDLISDLIAVQEAGKTLSAQELLDFCIVLLVAGNETTTNLLGNAILCFEEYPEALVRLKQEPALLPLAIEEVLRYRSPVQAMERFTKVETKIGGQMIPAGQRVTVWIGAANRDEAQFECAEEFIIDRNPNPHLSFGHGIHFCLGAALARLEGEIALKTVLERLPNLRIAPNVVLDFIPSIAVHGVTSLPVLL
jgi:cytochrome P450